MEVYDMGSGQNIPIGKLNWNYKKVKTYQLNNVHPKSL